MDAARTLLREEGLLLEDRARFYAAEMVLALEHLHALKVIHRDLKVSARRARPARPRQRRYRLVNAGELHAANAASGAIGAQALA